MDIHTYAKHRHDVTRNSTLQSLLQRKNTLLLGFPGSGKTVLTADLIKTLTLDHNKNIAITGTTGSAAQQVKFLLPEMDVTVQTLHSFLDFRNVEQYFSDWSSFEKHMIQQYKMPWASGKLDNIKKCDILIVDEVSLLTAEFIKGMDIALRVARKCPHKVYGNVVVFMVGDFRQIASSTKKQIQVSVSV